MLGTKTPHFVLILASCLFLGGCKATVVSRRFIGLATDQTLEWYRYRITETAGILSGVIDFPQEDGWVEWDKMEIIYQRKDEVVFKANFGVPGKALFVDYHLSLSPITDQGFTGKLKILNTEPKEGIELRFIRSDD